MYVLFVPVVICSFCDCMLCCVFGCMLVCLWFALLCVGHVFCDACGIVGLSLVSFYVLICSCILRMCVCVHVCMCCVFG